MNKQEALKKIEKLKGLTIKEKNLILDIEMISKGDVLEIISQIDESQKVVVPQFVAEYIEYCKHEKFYALHGAYDNMDDRLKCWRFKGNNSELFAKAWLYGYEVEKEKLYTVELPNNGGYYHIVLIRNAIGEIKLINTENVIWKESDYAQLTEAEIKQDFDWAWQFAKEVKND